MQSGKFNVIYDSSHGSSGKGKTSTWLADKFNVNHVSSANYPNAGHCLGGNTYVITNLGIEKIQDVVGRAFKKTTLVNMNGLPEEVSHFVPDGVRVVNTISLLNGINIDCTDIHRFYVWNGEKCDFEWVRSINLDPSTHTFLFPKNISFPERTLFDQNWSSEPKPNKKQIGLPVSEVRFSEYLGLLVGDGYYAKKTRVDIAFHTSQLDVMKNIQSMYTEMGITNQYISQVGDKECMVLSTSQCSGLMDLFEHVGLELATKDQKKSPTSVLSSNKKVLGGYIRGLFDSDGSVKSDRITFTNCSESVVRDAQMILTVLGVSSFVSSYDDHRGDRKTQFCLSVSGTRNLSHFRDVAGFLSQVKKSKLDTLIQSREDQGQYVKINSDVRTELRKGGFRTYNESMLSTTIERFAEEGLLSGPIVESATKYTHIPIKSIGFETKSIEVFDVTVPGTHSYLAYGCISHNTAAFADGTKFIAKAIPTAAILRKVKGVGIQCFISPGSGFGWDQVIKEWNESGRPDIFIHDRASIVTPEHKAREAEGRDSTKHIASTMQGSGTAISDKILRRPDVQLARHGSLCEIIRSMAVTNPLIGELVQNDSSLIQEFEDRVHVIDAMEFRNITHSVINAGHPWLHEGSQGYALSIDHGSHYPESTSRNCTVQAAMDYMAVPPKMVGDIYMNIRSFPIRVGSVVENGVQKGYSGDFYPDSKELTWEEVGQNAGMPSDEILSLRSKELTTVTKRLRRVSTISHIGLQDSAQVNGATKLILNFVQYVDWTDNKLRGGEEVFQKLSHKSRKFIDSIEKTTNLPVVLIGTGANHEDMIVRESLM